jgi:hypothetical protein
VFPGRRACREMDDGSGVIGANGGCGCCGVGAREEENGKRKQIGPRRHCEQWKLGAGRDRHRDQGQQRALDGGQESRCSGCRRVKQGED